MHRRSHLQPILLGNEEYQQLLNWSRNPRRAGRALALRARIILQCRHGRSNRQVAQRLGLPEQTVCKWRQRFLAERLQGLLDQPRSGAPRSISDSMVEAVLAKTLHRPALFPAPAFALRLALGEMADALLLVSQKVLPSKLTDSGYQFLQPSLAGALTEVFQK